MTEPYAIKLSNGLSLTTIQDATIDTTTSLRLLGRGVSNYGEIMADNLVHILENSANTVAPPGPLRGQLWFNNLTNTLEVYDGIAWHNIVTEDTASNQTITLTGDVSGSGTTTIPVTLHAPPGFVSAGTFEKITFDSKGRVLSGVNLNSGDITTAIGSLLTVNGAINASTSITGQNLTVKSGGGGAITFADGTSQTTAARIKISGQLSVYVDPVNGNNTNSGLTQFAPVKTLQFAANLVANHYDLQGGIANIYCRDGVYSTGVTLATNAFNGGIKFIGNTTTPTNCRVVVTSGNCFYAAAGALMYVSGFAVEAASQGLTADTNSRLIFDNVAFGPCQYAHIAAYTGAQILASGANTPYSIYGNAVYHATIGVAGNAIMLGGSQITLKTNIAFSAILWAGSSGIIMVNNVNWILNGFNIFGSRYVVSNGGYLYTAGGGVNAVGGSASGLTPGVNFSGYYE
jgi:hypothetical protein